MDERELIDEIVNKVKEKLGAKCAMPVPKGRAVVIGELSAEDERALKSAYDIIPFSETGDILIVAQMSAGLLARLALGLMDGSGEACILQALLGGERVYILESGMEYRRYRVTAYKPLYRMYQEYEEAVLRFGAQIITCIADMMEKNVREDVKGTECEDLTRIHLLRESDLMKIRNTGRMTVLLDRDAIITPLAADYIASHNLSVARQ